LQADATRGGRSPVPQHCHGFRAVHATTLVRRCPRHNWGSRVAVIAPTLLQWA